jgi:hypothetical protein
VIQIKPEELIEPDMISPRQTSKRINLFALERSYHFYLRKEIGQSENRIFGGLYFIEGRLLLMLYLVIKRKGL